MTEKLDLRKAAPAFYAPPRTDFVVVEVPRRHFVMIDGEGDPNTAPAYEQALQWLYTTSYGIKAQCKAAGQDYVVPPLEGLWWSEDHGDFTSRRKERWKWTMMIPAPDFATPEQYAVALARAVGKLGAAPASLRFEPLDEGLCVQILHVGSYDDEAPTIRRLHEEFVPANGLIETGAHHEIYLSDPRRTEPGRLRTILRQPVRRR